MPSNKPKVSAFLEDDELVALEQFRNSRGISNSEAIKRLIRGELIEGNTDSLNLVLNGSYDERVHRLEEKVESLSDSFCSSVRAIEKLGEQLAYLQGELERVNRRIERASEEYLTDDQVASYVGAREETVREWRLGIRKPRGTNICSLLSELELDMGRWRRKG